MSDALSSCWRDRLNRCAAGNQTVVEFCEREGVSASAYYYWKRRLEGRRHSGEGNGGATPLFLPVRLRKGANGHGAAGASVEGRLGSAIQIDLPNGAVVRVASNVSVEMIEAVIQATSRSAVSTEQAGC